MLLGSKKIMVTLMSTAFFTLGGSADAQKRPKRKPPQEAIDVCSSKAKDDTCSFTGKNSKAVEGTCFTPKADKPLACRPENGKKRQAPKKKQERN